MSLNNSCKIYFDGFLFNEYSLIDEVLSMERKASITFFDVYSSVNIIFFQQLKKNDFTNNSIK